MSNWINLNQVIAQYISESEQSTNKKFKLWQLAFRGMESLGIDFFYQIRSVKLPINANKTVGIPSDYINYTKLGVLNSNGEIIPLKYNGNLTLFADQLPDRISKTQDNTISDLFLTETPIWFNYWNGSSYVTLYGLPSGSPFVGSFKIDNANNIILLSEDFGYDYLMLEYVASPQVGGDYYIPMQFREALIAWMAWKDVANIPIKTHVNNANVQMRRHEYYNERRLANARYRPLYLEQAYELSLENQRLCVKA